MTIENEVNNLTMGLFGLNLVSIIHNAEKADEGKLIECYSCIG